jgi:hypothetical protein
MTHSFDDLREDFAAAFSAISDQGAAVQRFCEAANAEIDRLWADNAELRDELHAVSNRLEGLTRAVFSAEPAAVAERMINTGRSDG